ncbi:S1 family peptidase [Photobacterium sp. GSS17]|uniref:S1 family peptidase n=1 Tax=Photobacterium sp. GSS17 TaxID=3020715 RepID=UPI00235E1967|nr:serine protease [Photobacterium sp. GSS17]
MSGRFLLCLLCCFSASVFADLPDTIARIKPSIVGVGFYDKAASPRGQLFGTGFVIAPQLVATNAHVVNPSLLTGKRQFVVFIGTGRSPEVRTATVIKRDTRHDLAILKIAGSPLPALRLSTRPVREGERYSFTGFPIGAILGLYPATHQGIVASITPIATPANHARELTVQQLRQLKKPYDVYQFDATAYPGNSGSPVYHPETGEVIAIINKVFVKTSKESMLTDPSAITYAIPILHLITLKQSL